MENIILFDQDVQHYRISIYKEFHKIFFEELNLNLIVIYDKSNNTIKDNNNLFIGIDYTYKNFINEIKKNNPKIIIQFVWLRYLFLIPFMLWCKIKNIKIVLWSHGINLQKKNQPLKNQLYYLRQKLADALILYTPLQKKYIKTKDRKIFIANNTLNFETLPVIIKTKEELKTTYGYQNKIIILSVGRMDTNNRKISHLIKLSKLLEEYFKILIIGPGVDEKEIEEINSLTNIVYLGPIYNNRIVSEYYKLSDVFIMPGAIGLAINQAFYSESPVIIENVDQGPEAYYLKDGINGFYYNENDIIDLKNKIEIILKDRNYSQFSNNAKATILSEASFDKMIDGFIKAIRFLRNEG